jgi:hypothetical protein
LWNLNKGDKPVGSYPGTVQINFLGQNKAKGKVISALKNASSTPNQVIDGFVKAPQAPTPAGSLHHRSQKAQTLVRGALKNPAGGFSNRIQNLRPGLNPQRELRAKQTGKHSKVERFGGHVSTAGPKAQTEVLQGEIVNRRAVVKPQPPAAAMPSMVTSASHHRIERMLDAALLKADSHKQAMKYQAAKHFWQKPGFLGRRHGLKLGAMAFLVLGLGFFVAWQKVPGLSVRVAGMRAHLSATAPAYRPAGYSFAPASANNNVVTMKYASTVDKSKSYVVSEQSSSKNSGSIMDDSAAAGQQVQTAQANGVPIVIVAHKAICVNQGIKTTVDDNQANLSPNELLSIAKGVCG